MSTRQFTVIQGSTTSTRTINRTREAGVKTLKSGTVYPATQFHAEQLSSYWSATPTDVNDKTEWNLVSTLGNDGENNFGSLMLASNYTASKVRTGKHRVEFDLTLNSGVIDNGASDISQRPFVLVSRDLDEDPSTTNHSNIHEVVAGSNVIDVEVFDDGVHIFGQNFYPSIFFSARPDSVFDVTISNLKVTHDYGELTINRTAPVINSDKEGESRPLLSKVVGTALAAYSLKDLNDKAGTTKVARIRRSDNVEVELFGNGKIQNVSSGETPIAVSFASSAWSYTGWTTVSGDTDYYMDFSGAPLYTPSIYKTISGTIPAGTSISFSYQDIGSTGTWFVALYPSSGAAVDSETLALDGSYTVTLTNTSGQDLVNPSIKFFTITGGNNFQMQYLSFNTVIGDTATNTLSEFVKEGGVNYDAFVESWYDQTGNGYHANQLTIPSQPKIASGGIVYDYLLFDGTNDYLRLASDITVLNKPVSVFAVQDRQSNSSRYTVGNITAGRGVGFTYNGFKWFMTSNSLNVIDSNLSQPIDEQAVRTAIHTDDGSSNQISGYYNGTLLVDNNTTTSDASALAGNNVGTKMNTIGASKPLGSGPAYFVGRITSLILFNTNQTANRPAIEANLANNAFINLT